MESSYKENHVGRKHHTVEWSAPISKSICHVSNQAAMFYEVNEIDSGAGGWKPRLGADLKYRTSSRLQRIIEK